MTYRTETIADFLDAVASSQVTPAGGTTAAVVGAMGASLCEMVCVHTVEKDEHEDVAAELSDVRDDLTQERQRLLELADADADAVDALLDADGESEQAATKRATGVPLAIAESCLHVVEDAVVVTEKGTPTAVPDAATGAFLAHGALQASAFTVRYNVERIDEAFAAEMDQRATEVESKAETAVGQVMANVEATR